MEDRRVEEGRRDVILSNEAGGGVAAGRYPITGDPREVVLQCSTTARGSPAV